MILNATLVFAVFSSRHSNFRQGHGSSGSSSPATDSVSIASSISFYKATDCISADLRGGIEANNDQDVKFLESKKMSRWCSESD